MRLLCIAALLAFTAGASAELLWDNGDFDAYDAVSSGKGTNTYFGYAWMEVADDFEIAHRAGWSIDGLHFEGLCLFGDLQVDYVTVAFFEDDGTGLPDNDAFYWEEHYDVSVSDWYDPYWGYYYVEIDVAFEPVVLERGYYWVMMQPAGLWGDWFYHGGTTQQWGEYSATRWRYWKAAPG